MNFNEVSRHLIDHLIGDATEHIIYNLQAPIQNFIPEIVIEEAVQDMVENTKLNSDQAGMLWDALVDELDGLNYKIIANEDYKKIVNFILELQILPLGDL